MAAPPTKLPGGWARRPNQPQVRPTAPAPLLIPRGCLVTPKCHALHYTAHPACGDTGTDAATPLRSCWPPPAAPRRASPQCPRTSSWPAAFAAPSTESPATNLATSRRQQQQMGARPSHAPSCQPRARPSLGLPRPQWAPGAWRHVGQGVAWLAFGRQTGEGREGRGGARTHARARACARHLGATQGGGARVTGCLSWSATWWGVPRWPQMRGRLCGACSGLGLH